MIVRHRRAWSLLIAAGAIAYLAVGISGDLHRTFDSSLLTIPGLAAAVLSVGGSLLWARTGTVCRPHSELLAIVFALLMAVGFVAWSSPSDSGNGVLPVAAALAAGCAWLYSQRSESQLRTDPLAGTAYVIITLGMVLAAAASSMGNPGVTTHVIVLSAICELALLSGVGRWAIGAGATRSGDR